MIVMSTVMNTVMPPVMVFTRRLLMPNMNLFYPVVSGLPNVAVQQSINNRIYNLVIQLIAQQGYYENPQTQVTGWYELKSNLRGILSLNIGNYSYSPMAAHGLTVIKSLTFDIQTGREYQLSDLFKPGSDYVSLISENIRKQIAERDIPLLDNFKGISPNQDYYIADKALVVYFQTYEITPYVVGLPMFPISVFELQEIAADNGPIDRMATND